MVLAIRRWHVPGLVAAAASAAYILSGPSRRQIPQSAEIDSNLEQSIARDAQSWRFNRYDPGSVSGGHVVKVDEDNEFIIRADYTFNSGTHGWVLAKLIGDRIACLQYWDRNGCEPIRNPYSGARAAATASPPSSDAGEALKDCLLNEGLPGLACKEAGVGVDTDAEDVGKDEGVTQPEPPDQPAQSEPEPTGSGGSD